LKNIKSACDKISCAPNAAPSMIDAKLTRVNMSQNMKTPGTVYAYRGCNWVLIDGTRPITRVIMGLHNQGTVCV